MASAAPPPDSSLFLAPPLESFNDQILFDGFIIGCNLCCRASTNLEVLPCSHTFCRPCLDKVEYDPEKIQCPKCDQVLDLPSEGASGFYSGYIVEHPVASSATEDSPRSCTSCKTKDNVAVASCYDCLKSLCENCVRAHKFMHIFEDHRVVRFNECQYCPCHATEVLQFFCRTCNIPICEVCVDVSHPKELHDYDDLLEIGSEQAQQLLKFLGETKAKIDDRAKSCKNLISLLQDQYHKAITDLNETYKLYCLAVENRKDEFIKSLNEIYKPYLSSFRSAEIEIQEKIYEFEKMSSFVTKSTPEEILKSKVDIEAKLIAINSYYPEIKRKEVYFEFVSNYQAIQNGVLNTFGYIRHKPECAPSVSLSDSYARPDSATSKGYPCGDSGCEMLSNNGSISTELSDISQYEKWSDASKDTLLSGAVGSFSSISEPVLELTSNFLALSIYPLISQVKRQVITYHCKFGEFGLMEGQFTEPSGLACNAQDDIIVADTNSSRVQVLDKVGRFKFEFGKNDGQLTYPNRVAVVKISGDIIVTERNPKHQVHIYNQYGQFVRKFGSDVLQHPRGLTVDLHGNILVVESKVMRVVIFDQFGAVLNKFTCGKHLEFPNGIAASDKEEIFICDNKKHCVIVFNYLGQYLRQIGGTGITNFPIAVMRGQNNEILVADNHNNFNLTVFTDDGQLLGAFESKVKHSKCFDVALMDNHSVVLASKDYHLYIYSYKPSFDYGIKNL